MSRLARGRYAAARRVLFCVLVALLAALPVTSGDLPGVWSADGAVEGCDCCPDETPGDGEDCCETDGGACCAPGVSAALVPTTTPAAQAQPVLLESREVRPTHLLLPRANGPPPTPPPIT